MIEVQRGDIYYIVSNYQEEGSEQRAGRPAVIVSNEKCNKYSNVIEVVYLTTQPKADLPTHIDIKSANRPSIALCEQICSVSKDRLGDYIGACTKYELEMLNAGMMISLDIDFPIQKAEVNNQENKAKQIPCKDEPTADLIKAITERNMFERLYYELLEKITRGVIGV